ncbi:PrgI family protein [Hespellia stercorisuis DSM 15480]|uniref:PrgI family protein n=2 Tax=Hespellia stercorisuis TaxID=180311 RepID=A0A1M6WAV7_9FIRM|nr:PrgI family protein [Hespellia stercorisuis]SHK90913.1 PrgI family protein [Hespellia stercorisuis DSM 15480]
MNKEIRDYQESMFFGLNFRQFLFSLLAIAIAVGIYFGTNDVLGEEMTGWICMLGAAPFAACGFFKYHGMTAEQFLWTVIKSELLYPKKLTFHSENLYYACLQECIEAGKQSRSDGSQIIEARRKKTEKKISKKTEKKGRSFLYTLKSKGN